MDELIIEAGRTEAHYWRDLWRYRDLFYFLAWRDLLVRYKQTVFGVLWAVLRPFLTMVIFVAIFSRIAGLPSDGVPYAILVLGGMLPWQFFASSLSESSNSLVSHANLIASRLSCVPCIKEGHSTGIAGRLPELESGPCADVKSFFSGNSLQFAGVAVRRSFYERDGGFLP